MIVVFSRLFSQNFGEDGFDFAAFDNLVHRCVKGGELSHCGFNICNGKGETFNDAARR